MSDVIRDRFVFDIYRDNAASPLVVDVAPTVTEPLQQQTFRVRQMRNLCAVLNLVADAGVNVAVWLYEESTPRWVLLSSGIGVAPGLLRTVVAPLYGKMFLQVTANPGAATYLGGFLA